MDDPLVDTYPLYDSDAALKPFLQAAKESSSSNYSTLLSLVSKVLSHPEIFAGYDQLKTILTEPLQKSDNKGKTILRTLDLFSYGCYADYAARSSSDSDFMELSDAQIFKLRQLTVVSLAHEACQQKSDHLSYATVQQALQLEEKTTSSSATSTATPMQKYRAVEQILISCLYSGLVAGRLCQKTQSLRWKTTGQVVSRDVPQTAVPHLISTVRQLQSRLQQAQQHLTRAEQEVHESLRQDEQFWKRTESSSRPSSAEAWSTAMVGHPGFLTAEVTSAAAAMDVTGRRQNKRSRGGLTTSGGGVSAFQI